jgi:hypothetical protein
LVHLLAAHPRNVTTPRHYATSCGVRQKRTS